MGASAPKSETVVKSPKPVIVREYMAPSYLKELGNMAEYWNDRAQQAASTRQANVNSYLSHYGVNPVYSEYKTAQGNVIEPYQASGSYNINALVNAAKEGGMFKPIRGPRRKEATPPRTGYLDAVQASTNKTPTGLPKPGSYQNI